MGKWTGRIRAQGFWLDAEVWYEKPEETHQGFRWHGTISSRRLKGKFASPEAAHTLATDVGTIQIESIDGDRISFRGCGAPSGALAAAIEATAAKSP
jgi:hypothetical protein